MVLRRLDPRDASYMLEWMHDASVVRDLRRDFLSLSIADCQAFIEAAKNSAEDLHLAVADDTDEYMGTVSLKYITETMAECAIVMRTCAMGKGYAQFGIKELFQIGFQEYHLQTIYWCVSSKNRHALRFWDKCGFRRCVAPVNQKCYTPEEVSSLIWYCVSAEEKVQKDGG